MAVTNPSYLDNTRPDPLLARPPESPGPLAGDGRYLVVLEREGSVDDLLVGASDVLDDALALGGAALDVLEIEGVTGASVVVVDRDGGEWRPVL